VKSGVTVGGVTHWYNRDAAFARVVGVDNRRWVEETDEGDVYASHGHSIIQFDEDVNADCLTTVDIESLLDWDSIPSSLNTG
jgi:hypothetical protein